MNRLTTNEPNTNYSMALNRFYIKDRMTWVRGGGPGPDYPDVTLPEYMRAIIKKHNTDIPAESDEELDAFMCELLFDGTDTLEGILAELYCAGWAFSTLHKRLSEYEDTGMTPEEAAERKTVDPLPLWHRYGAEDRPGRYEIVWACRIGWKFPRLAWVREDDEFTDGSEAFTPTHWMPIGRPVVPELPGDREADA